MSDRKPLSNKAAVVTGAGRGIGRAIAIGFAKAGADVAILARTESELSQVAEAVTGHGVRCHVGPVDLSDPEATEKACADVVAGLGDVDILVSLDDRPGWTRFFDVQRYLEEALGRPVDLVVERALRAELRPLIEAEAIRV